MQQSQSKLPGCVWLSKPHSLKVDMGLLLRGQGKPEDGSSPSEMAVAANTALGKDRQGVNLGCKV